MSAFSELYTKQIEKDLDWREAELSILRKLLMQTSVNSVQQKTLLRANLAMIYAHYEGFCKFALSLYIEAVNKRRLKRKELQWPIATHSMHKFVDELKAEKRSDKFFQKFLNEFDMHLDEIAHCENIAETSNLWPDLLIAWLERLGLPTINVKSKNFFLRELVDTRNKVAHGEGMHVKDLQALTDYADAAMLAMHEVAVEISDALEKRSYQRYSQVYSILGHAP